MKATNVLKPEVITGNANPNFNRSPLLGNPLAKLPLGSIFAKGWLKHQLTLMASGMTGRLGELSSFLGPRNGWFEANRHTWNDHGWEEQPYWLRGFYSLAVQTQNPSSLAEATQKRKVADQPWTVQDAPIELTARAKKIPGWKLVNETVDVLPKSPVHSRDPEEKITLIPLGCARLRMSCLPIIGD